MKVTLLAGIVTGLLTTLTQCSPNTVMVKINTKKCLHTAREDFLSIALDCSLITTGLQTFDFEDAGVVAMAKGLSPAILRLGGTACDYVFFNHSSLVMLRSLPWRKETAILKNSVWDRFTKLARVANLTLLFDANVMLRNKLNQWDPSNFIDFLNYNEKKGYENLMFELGNEPNNYPAHFNVTITGEQLAADFATMRKMVDSYPLYKGSYVVGADVGNPYLPKVGLQLDPAKFIRDFLRAGHASIDALTWHQYYFPGSTAHVEDFINATIMDTFQEQVAIVNAIINEVLGPGKTFPVWMGETSSAYNSGAKNLSNTYVAGFLWMDKLGVAARSGYDVVIRQTFYGGWYSLIDKQLNPNPDYWLSLLYKRLVGTKALSLSLSANNSVRAYASCTNLRYGVEAGSVTVYAMNLDRLTSAMISVDVKYNSLRSFNMEPTDGTLTSLHVNINGERMRLVNKTLPEIHANITDYIVLKPLTFGFFVLVGANATACM